VKLFFTQCKVGSTNLNVNNHFWLLEAPKMHHLRVLLKIDSGGPAAPRLSGLYRPPLKTRQLRP